VRAHLLIGGVAWALKKQDGVIQDTMVHVELRRQFASYYAFGKNGLRTSFIPDRVAIETTAGQVVAERSDPRAAFDGHVLDTPWDMLELAYFLGYALWNYLTNPFSFAQRAAAHYTSEYREFDGIMVPTRRRVYPVDAEGNVANEPFLVTIDLDSIAFS
jgi:hypothetical protein